MEYNDHIEHYKTDAEAYDFFNVDKFSVQEHRRRYETFFDLYKVNSGNKILEIGSGGGHAVKFTDNAVYYPLDISSHNLKKIRANSSKEVLPVSGDVYKLPFETESFDFIILSEVLEHLAYPKNALKEIYRVLKLNGAFIVSVPYKEKISYQLCVHCNKLTPTNSHLHSFDEEKLRALLEPIGYRVKRRRKALNKISNRLHVNIILKSLPYKLWRIVDGLFNRMMDKPASIVLLCNK